MKDLITAKQLSEAMGITLKQVYHLTPTLPHHRLGKYVRYDLEAVLKATQRGEDK